MKVATDINQSKILAEILPKESADMTWVSLFDLDHIEPKHSLSLCPYNYYSGVGVPAWSLAALEGLMPFHIIENNNRFGFYQVKGFNKQGETYRFGYKTNNDSFLFETSWYNDVVDAAFEMVVWLKENEKL